MKIRIMDRMQGEEERASAAAAAPEDEIVQYVHDPSPKVLKALLGNLRISEDNVLIIVNRKNVQGDILGAVARDRRWSDSYPVRLALVRNPRCPLSVSLSFARYLRLFDLEEITRNRFIPLVFRHKIESIIIDQIPTMPLGNKKTLAKISASNVLLRLLRDAEAGVAALCLNNPNLHEAQLYKVITRKDVVPDTVRLIAEHPIWSNRSGIRFAIVRNPHVPLSLAVPFLRTLKVFDLRDLFEDPLLPVSIKPFVYRELLARGKNLEQALGEETIELSAEEEKEALDDALFEDFNRRAVDGSGGVEESDE